MSDTSQPPMQTFEVTIAASALRTMKVRARTGREAQETAEVRIQDKDGPWVTSGPWTIDFPGSVDEHWTVTRAADKEIVGPFSQGEYDDDPRGAGNEDDEGSGYE